MLALYTCIVLYASTWQWSPESVHTHTQMPLWFEKDSHQGLIVAGSIGVAQSRIGRARRLTPSVFGLVAVALSRFGRAIVFPRNRSYSGNLPRVSYTCLFVSTLRESKSVAPVCKEKYNFGTKRWSRERSLPHVPAHLPRASDVGNPHPLAGISSLRASTIPEGPSEGRTILQGRTRGLRGRKRCRLLPSAV